MELFETYENHESIHDILRESLDDEMEIVRAMHNYEMKSVYMEAAKSIDEDEVEEEMDAEMESFLADDDILTEGQNREAKKINKEYMKDAKTLAKEAKSLCKAGKYSEAKSKYTQAAGLMRKASKEIDKLDPSWGSAIIGNYVVGLKSVAKGILLAIPTLGLGFLYQEVKYIIDGLEMTVKVINKVRAGKELSATDFNAAIKRLKDSCDKLAKKYDELAKECGKKKAGVKESFELDEFDPLMEAAGDVFARIKIAAKQLFDNIIRWIKNAIKSLTVNADAYKKFAEKYRSEVEKISGSVNFKPDGYKAYTYVSIMSVQLTSLPTTNYIAGAAKLAAEGDKKYIEEIKSDAEEYVTVIRQSMTFNNNIDAKTDHKTYVEELRKQYRGKEVTSIGKAELTSALNYLMKFYSDDIKFFNDLNKMINDRYKQVMKELKDIEASVRKTENAPDEAVKAVNMYWTECKRGFSDILTAAQIGRESSAERAVMSKRIIAQAVKESGKSDK